MTYRDDFLVKKLKEILQRLYPTPETSPIILRNPSKSSKFPKLFVSLSSSETETLYSDNESIGEIEIEQERDNNVTIFQDSDPNRIGIVHNLSSIDHFKGENSSLILGTINTKQENNNDIVTNEENALTRNLHEFIQVLKMSLSSGSSGQNKEDNTSGSGSTSSDTTFSNSNNFEFNLTLDDITDLNTLLDGSENVIQFKQVAIISLYVLIAVVSIVGNLLVVQLVIRSRRLHTLTHALLANMALANLCMATLNIPFSLARVILTEWQFGDVLCHLVPFVQVMSVYVTSFTMAVIAIDRYSVIMNPLGTRLKSSHGVGLVFAIWLLSGLLSLPYAIHHKVVRVLIVGVVSRCQFGPIDYRHWLTVGTFLAQYFFPLLFTTISYLAIMQRLRQRSDGLGSTTPRQMEAQSRAKKRTIKMLALTVVFFAVSWAPINIYHLITHFSLVRHNSTAILVCHLIAMSSCTVNPFIYCWFNDHFRREALKWMRCFRTRRCPIVHPGIEINGMLTRADRDRDRTCARTRDQSTTIASTSLRSPRLPESHSHNRIVTEQSGLVVRSTQMLSPTNHSHSCNNGGSPNSTKNSILPFIDHPLSNRKQKSNNTANEQVEIEIEVRYRERPESLFLVRKQSYEDIFVSAATSISSRNQRQELEDDDDDDDGFGQENQENVASSMIMSDDDDDDDDETRKMVNLSVHVEKCSQHKADDDDDD